MRHLTVLRPASCISANDFNGLMLNHACGNDQHGTGKMKAGR
jgi:hypothetical protein